MEALQDGSLWALMLDCILSFTGAYFIGHYVYASLPIVLRVIVLLVGVYRHALSHSEDGNRLLFIATSAPILLAFRQALLSSGGPMIQSAIMSLCYFLVPGSAGIPSRKDDFIRGYRTMLYFAYGVLIPDTELTWSFAKSKLKEPMAQWFLLLAFALAVASACYQFPAIFRRFIQERYLAVNNAAFLLYRKWLAWYYRRRFLVLSKSSGPFEYNHLDPAASEIRLLKLSPTRQGAQVQGSLIVSPMVSVPAYEAISYRWKMGSRVPILLNGQELHVFEAVYFMLLGLRHTNDHRFVWVDAICINQRDTTEKEWQILLMGDIFGSAERVLSWLDYHPLNSGALSFLGALGSWADEINQLEACGRMDLFDTIPMPSNVKTILEQPHHLLWASLCSVFCNDWFSRVWVVQEVARGREVMLCHAHEELTWQALYLAVLILSPFYSSGNDVHMPSLGKDHSQFGINNCNIISISTLRNKLRQEPQGLPLGFLLREAQWFKATIPRDMVYGLLGLCTDMARKRVVVDYAMSEDVLFQDISRYILLEEQSLDYLLTAGTGFLWPEGNRPDPQLPSWVPPRRHPFGIPSTVANTAVHLFQTATHLSPLVEAVNGEKDLVSVQGAYFDHIALISPIFLDPEHTSQSADMKPVEKMKLLLSNIDMAFDFARQGTLPHLYGRDASDTLWTLITIKVNESDPNQMPTKETILESAKTDVKVLREGSKFFGRNSFVTVWEANGATKAITIEETLNLLQHESSLRTSVMPTFDKRLCWTSKGYLGVVPPHSEIGDQICVFSGGNLPCVIRPRAQRGENTQYRSYELLGACYIQGIAHGELSQVDLAMEPIILG